MTPSKNRREFLRNTTVVGAGLAAWQLAPSAEAEEAPAPTPQPASSEPFVVGIIGTGGRGQTVAGAFALSPGVVVKYLCDVDDTMLAKAQEAVANRVAKANSAEPAAEKASASQGVKDFRRILEDDAVHAVAIVTPDHWHAPAAILACQAGKHVFVEKPCSHNAREGELLIEAARKYGRVIQHGTQRRSWPGMIKAINAVRGGEIGNVRLARAWYAVNRPSIARGRGVPVPPNLDFALWQGPAPERPYRDNILPYDWHWFWDWGTGELGNNGVHFLDLCRWGMAVDYPKRVTSAGGRYFFSDDWETPDTQTATFDFGDRFLVWEHRSCQPHGVDGHNAGVMFHGDKGSMLLTDKSLKVFDSKDKPVREEEGLRPSQIDAAHVADFVDAARKGRRPAAHIEEGHKSTLLCHLGNIAFRTGRTLNIDPKTGHIIGDEDAVSRFWSREYRPEWEPKV